MTTEALQQLTMQACEAVKETARFIRQESGKVADAQIEEKFLNGLVSYVDRTAEEMLVSRLSAIYPEADFITEEETVAQSTGGAAQWIIDPLDGTTNFLYGVPHYSISVALRLNQQLVIGIVHHVPADELFYAWQGGGAWMNGAPIRVSQRKELRQALISTGFPYHNFSRSTSWFDALHAYLEQGRAVRRFGSAALDLAWVACGRFDVFFEYGLNAWDVAGGAVLVQEAGGRVCDFSGGADFMEHRELFASNANVHEAAYEIVKKSFLPTV